MKSTTLLSIFITLSATLLLTQCKKDDASNTPSNTNTNLIATWKINPAGSMAPWGIAVDSKDNLFTSDLFASKLNKSSSEGALITSWGSAGSSNGQFNWPKHIAIDGSDNIYVTDEQNNRIQKFNSSGTYLAQWGNPSKISGELAWGAGTVAVDRVNNWIYVVDGSNRLQKMDLSGNLITQWGGTGTADGKLRLADMTDLANQGPNGQMAVDETGNVYVVDNMNCRIQKFTSSGTFLMKWGTKGSDGGQFLFPVGIAIDNINGYIYVSDNSTQNGGAGNVARIEKFSLLGNFIKQWNIREQSGNQSVSALAVDNSGNVLAIEGVNVSKYNFK